MFAGAISYDRHADNSVFNPARPFEKGYQQCTKKFETLVLHMSLLSELRKMIPLPSSIEAHQYITLISTAKFNLQKEQAFAEWLPHVDRDTHALIGTLYEMDTNAKVNRVISCSTKEGSDRWGQLY
jgi:hypothetical protein